MSLLNKNGFTEMLFDVAPQILHRRYLVMNIEPRTVQYVIAGPLHRWQVSGIRIAERLLWNFGTRERTNSLLRSWGFLRRREMTEAKRSFGKSFQPPATQRSGIVEACDSSL